MRPGIATESRLDISIWLKLIPPKVLNHQSESFARKKQKIVAINLGSGYIGLVRFRSELFWRQEMFSKKTEGTLWHESVHRQVFWKPCRRWGAGLGGCLHFRTSSVHRHFRTHDDPGFWFDEPLDS